MATIKEDIYPPEYTLPTHKLSRDSVFVTTENAPLAPQEFFSSLISNKISFGEEVIVIEEAVGFNCTWNKVIYQGVTGYVIREYLERVSNNIKPSIPPNIDRDFNPQINDVPAIDWTTINVDEPVYDRKTAKYILRYDTGIDNIEDKNIKEIMETSLYKGVKLILREEGKKFDRQFVNNLIENYFLFAKAEKYYFEFRPCSTMHVLVSIPARYLQSRIIPENDVSVYEPNENQDNPEYPTDSEGNYDPDAPSAGLRAFGSRGSGGSQSTILTREYSSLIELEHHFGVIEFLLAQNELIRVANRWIIEPSGLFLNLTSEIFALKAFKNTLKNFIKKNKIAFIPSPINYADIFRNEQFEKDGKLIIYFDEDNKSLKSIKFKAKDSEKLIPLNRGAKNFFNSGFIKNETIVNYLLKIPKKESIGSLLAVEAGKTLLGVAVTTGIVAGAAATVAGAPATTIGVTATSLGILATQTGIEGSLADSFNIEFERRRKETSGNDVTDRDLTPGENIQEGLDYASAIANGAVGAATAITDKLLENIEGIAQFLEELAPVTAYKDFIFSYHYPRPTTLESLPIDLVDCIVDNSERLRYLTETKTPEFKEAWTEFWVEYEKRDKFYKESNFGQLLLQDAYSLRDNLIVDPNIRKLFGLDPDFDENLDPISAAGKGLNQALALFDGLDWQRFLAEAIKCSAFSFNPPDLQALIQNYQKVRKLLEGMAAMTVCNPYLTAALKEINSFQLPVLKVKNRNGELIEQLKKIVYQVINDSIILLIRQLLTNSLKNCLTDKNPNFNSNPNNLNDIIDDPINDPELDNLLDDLFDIKEPDGTIDPNNKIGAREALKELLNDILPCLSALEICELLNGKVINSDVYQFIINLIKKKGYNFSSGYATTIISDVLNSEVKLREFFAALGRISSLPDCQDIIDNSNPRDRINPLCNGEQIECLRKGILDGKGLPRDKIDDLLKDIRDQETKNLDDVLKYLEDPEKITNKDLPVTLCRDGVPPIVSLGPKAESFKNLTNNLFSDVYTQFNDEAREWYKTTYTLSSSASTGGNFLIFDSDIGRITAAPQSTIQNINDKIKDKNAREQLSSGSQEKIPAFLFNSSFANNGTFKPLEQDKGLSYTAEYLVLNNYLNGYEQQKYDLTIIENAIRQQIFDADEIIKQFLGKLMACITAYGTNAFLETITANNKPQSVSSDNVVSGIISKIRNISQQPFIKFLKLMDIFLRNNTVDLSNNSLSLLTSDNTQISNAFYFADNSFPASLKIMEYLESEVIFNNSSGRITTLSSFLNEIGTINLNGLNNLITNLGVNLNFSSTSDPTETFSNYFGDSTNNVDLNRLYDNAKKALNPVKKSYEIVKKATINYPSFTISGTFNLNNLSFGPNKVITNTDLSTLNDFYILNIKKNNNNYLEIKNGERIKDEVYDYITSSLQIKNDITKNSVFLKMLSMHNEDLKDSINIEHSSRLILENIRKNIFDNNIFLQNEKIQEIKHKTGQKAKDANGAILKDNAGNEIDEEKTVSVKEPFTRYYSSAIVGKPATALDKQCGLNKHYLDIDGIKESIINENNKRICKTAETLDERLQNSLQISSAELTNIQTNEEQNIMQTGFYRLAIRTFAHDIMLRSISIFGRYDPQSLRNDSLFLEFMSNLIESEMRGLDNTFYEMLTRHFIKIYSLKYKVSIPQQQYGIFKKIIFKNIVKEELQTYVLVKFAKRLDIDCNEYLPSGYKLKIINIYDDFIQENNVIKEIDGSMYIQTDDGYKKIFEGSYDKFRGSTEFKTLFEYVFPLTKYLSFYFINHVMSTSTRRQVVDAFRNTKKVITNTTKLVVSNGEPIAADPENLQDVLNEDGAEFFKKFIFEALVQTPIKIFKAFIEGSEPNITLSSTIYKTAKFFIPETPSVLIPAISLPLGLIPTPLTCLIPFTNPILSLIYFAGLLWYEDGTEDQNAREKDTVSQWVDAEQLDCSQHIMSNKEDIPINEFGFYDIKKGIIDYKPPTGPTISEETQAPGESSGVPRTL